MQTFLWEIEVSEHKSLLLHNYIFKLISLNQLRQTKKKNNEEIDLYPNNKQCDKMFFFLSEFS